MIKSNRSDSYRKTENIHDKIEELAKRLQLELLDVNFAWPLQKEKNFETMIIFKTNDVLGSMVESLRHIQGRIAFQDDQREDVDHYH